MSNKVVRLGNSTQVIYMSFSTVRNFWRFVYIQVGRNPSLSVWNRVVSSSESFFSDQGLLIVGFRVYASWYVYAGLSARKVFTLGPRDNAPPIDFGVAFRYVSGRATASAHVQGLYVQTADLCTCDDFCGHFSSHWCICRGQGLGVRGQKVGDRKERCTWGSKGSKSHLISKHTLRSAPFEQSPEGG